MVGFFHVGKTMLMDMFYSATDGMIRHRQRFHFHEVSEWRLLRGFFSIVLWLHVTDFVSSVGYAEDK